MGSLYSLQRHVICELRLTHKIVTCIFQGSNVWQNTAPCCRPEDYTTSSCSCLFCLPTCEFTIPNSVHGEMILVEAYFHGDYDMHKGPLLEICFPRHYKGLCFTHFLFSISLSLFFSHFPFLIL